MKENDKYEKLNENFFVKEKKCKVESLNNTFFSDTKKTKDKKENKRFDIEWSTLKAEIDDVTSCEDEFDFSLAEKLLYNDEKNISNKNNQSASHNSLSEKRKNKMQESVATEIAKIFNQRNILIIYNDQCYVYTGTHYQKLSFEKYLQLSTNMLKCSDFYSPIVKTMPSISILKESFKFLRFYMQEENLHIENRVERDRDKISFLNGVYDAKKKKFKMHDSKYLTFFRFEANFVEFCDWEESEVFNNYCNLVAPFGEEQQFKYSLLEFLGSMPTNRITKKWQYLAPARDSGKTVWGDFCKFVLGKESTANLLLNEFGGKYALAEIIESCLVIAAEGEPGVLNAKTVTRIKEITGETQIRARQIYQEAKIVAHSCKILATSNFPLEIKVQDDAFWERVIVIPYVRTVPKDKQDRKLLQKLINDADAICSLAAKAYGDVVENGYTFTEVPEGILLKDRWSKRENSADYVMQFVQNQCILEEEEVTISRDLYEEFVQFCRANGIYPPEVRNLNNFSKAISDNLGHKLFSTRKRDAEGKSQRAFKGIKLLGKENM